MNVRNNRGQMAIFIALFFQVLFVFFAMAINVGLVVHDKINLQNAVDIAAYYGAAKQGEILNQIGHINYQMRQNYKLFVWRYRVLSTLGLNAHPLKGSSVNSLLPEADISSQVVPSVCVAHEYWQEYFSLDPNASLCRQTNQTIPNIRPATGGSGFVPGYSSLVSFTQMANNQLAQLCAESGILNFLFAARILVHLRVDGLLRKNLIERLADKLKDSKDLRDESIETGVRNTFENNLTNSNLSGIQNFQYFNSMSTGQCADKKFWLPEIKINPVLMYVDFEPTGAVRNCTSEIVTNRIGSGSGRPVIQGLDNLPRGLSNSTLSSIYTNTVNELVPHWAGEPTTDLHSSIGFEKNPWCMVYSGVKATTAVRKPFSPLGGTITLEAHGFAKPFGGRIGPWYGKSWQQGSPNSQATNRNQMVDALLPSRDVAGNSSSASPQDDIANYSRFPGDTLGLKSARAMTSMINSFKSTINLTSTGTTTPPLAWATYNHLGGRPSLESLGDSLARDSNIKAANQRQFELAAVAPDTFDALYYSIEPRYYDNYFFQNTTNGGALFQPQEKIYDFGSSKQNYNGINEQFSIMDEVSNATQIYHPDVDYIVRDWRNLLTGWHQKAAVDFTLDPKQFGHCEAPVTNSELPTTGNCIVGGRTGYSIKNISINYLNSSDHQLGGATGSTGSILNPPAF
jgi:hypothetical protein